MPTTPRQRRPSRGPIEQLPSPDIQVERQAVLGALHTVVELMGMMIGPNVELVLHDLTIAEKSIVAIANGHVSKRGVGHAILGGPEIEQGFDGVIETLTVRGAPEHEITPEYTRITHSGQRLRSATATFRDSQGDPFAALTLNADMAVVEMAHLWLDRMLHGHREVAPDMNAAPEMDTLAREIIADSITLLGKPLSLMNKDEKVHAVGVMMERGLFMVKGGVEKAAAALGVSRFTVYNYLDALRERDGESEHAPVRKQKPTSKPK